MYQIIDLLGSGTFGQVAKCINLKTNQLVALKIIKSKPAYHQQSLIEIQLLLLLNSKYDPLDKHHIARIKDHFVWKNHLCISFEILSINLYELVKQNGFKGLSLSLVRVFTSQLLDALSILNRAKIIHCDVKPEVKFFSKFNRHFKNILLKGLESPSIKLIDFGSACKEYIIQFFYFKKNIYK